MPLSRTNKLLGSAALSLAALTLWSRLRGAASNEGTSRREVIESTVDEVAGIAASHAKEAVDEVAGIAAAHAKEAARATSGRAAPGATATVAGGGPPPSSITERAT